MRFKEHCKKNWNTFKELLFDFLTFVELLFLDTLGFAIAGSLMWGLREVLTKLFGVEISLSDLTGSLVVITNFIGTVIVFIGYLYKLCVDIIKYVFKKK